MDVLLWNFSFNKSVANGIVEEISGRMVVKMERK
jgi:hypothetical protein